MRKATGSYRTYSIPGKTGALVPEFALDDLPSAELQPRFLRLQRRTCPWAEYYDDDDDDGGANIVELRDSKTGFCRILKFPYSFQNFAILILCILHFQNRVIPKFNFKW